MAGYRLPDGGSRLDRSRPLRFTFDGRPIAGFAGDTVASALLASGRTLGRPIVQVSPAARRLFRRRGRAKRPGDRRIARGRREPNSKATMVEAADGLEARSQNAWPSLGADIGAVNGVLGRFFAAGFYYKTFMGPFRGSWMLYEPFIRRAAGMGAASFEADPDRYEMAHAFCDVLVVGGGAAGLSAALAAGRDGARVLVCRRAAGARRLAGSREQADRGAKHRRVAPRHTRGPPAMPNVRLLTRVNVYGYYDDNVLGSGGTVGLSNRYGLG